MQKLRIKWGRYLVLVVLIYVGFKISNRIFSRELKSSKMQEVSWGEFTRLKDKVIAINEGVLVLKDSKIVLLPPELSYRTLYLVDTMLILVADFDTLDLRWNNLVVVK